MQEGQTGIKDWSETFRHHQTPEGTGVCCSPGSSLCEGAEMLSQSRAAAYDTADAVKSGGDML